MADTTRRVFCKTCQKEVSIYDAHAYNLGRSTTYECMECYLKSATKADGFHISVCQRMKRMRKEK